MGAREQARRNPDPTAGRRRGPSAPSPPLLGSKVRYVGDSHPELRGQTGENLGPDRWFATVTWVLFGSSTYPLLTENLRSVEGDHDQQ
jgi:hypothetical protein